MTPEPKAILFDMDGTLVDWRTGMDEKWFAACEDACARVKLLDAQTLYETILRRRTWFWEDRERATRGRMDLLAASVEIATRALADLGLDDPPLARAIATDFRRRREEALKLYDGAVETLAAACTRHRHRAPDERRRRAAATHRRALRTRPLLRLHRHRGRVRLRQARSPRVPPCTPERRLRPGVGLDGRR